MKSGIKQHSREIYARESGADAPCLLDGIHSPSDLRVLSRTQLSQVAAELRSDTIDCVSKTGGHLGAGLGVVELTVALHYAFDTPTDLIVWDVGHQAYPHKILTGRRARMSTLRQQGGLSGFTKRGESAFDHFGAGHAGTSISAALGFCSARDLLGQRHHVVAVIGDSSICSGMALEALNNAAATTDRLIVILNDNGMSIAPAVGALCAYFQTTRTNWKQAKDIIGIGNKNIARSIFDELGFRSVGPIDGHNVDELLDALEAAKQVDCQPVLIHVVTEKGKGFREEAPSPVERFHSIGPFGAKVEQPAEVKKPTVHATYTDVFATTLTALAGEDEKILAITAAMPSGTGVSVFGRAHPARAFDVGISEQHAVTFAAGLAAEGMKPFVAIYSTFLQRAYDQIVHDVALQTLPVRFMIDRAGLVGADGATHTGAYDLVCLMALPNFTIMTPSDGAELAAMVALAAQIDDGPSAIRYPRGNCPNVPEGSSEPLVVGRGRVIRRGSRLAVLSVGSRLVDVLEAADDLGRCLGGDVTVADARFAKPLDMDLIEQLARTHEALLIVEEGAAGGVGTVVLSRLAQSGHTHPNLKVRALSLPDYFIEHGDYNALLVEAGLDVSSIISTGLELLGLPSQH